MLFWRQRYMEVERKRYMEQGMDLKRLLLVLGKKLWLVLLGAILGAMFGLYGIFYAVPLSELASFSMASFMINRENKNVWSVNKHE